MFACAGALVAAGCGSSEVTFATTTTATSAAPTTTAPAATPTTPSTTAAPTTTTPPTTAPPTTAPPTTAPPREPVVIGIAGDSTFTNGLETRDPFGTITELLEAPDLMIINLETAVADSGVGRPPVAKSFLFRSPPASLDLLVEAGIDGVTLGNNHTLDFGVPALEQTLQEIDSRGLLRTGAGLDEAEAYTPLIAAVGDWTIGIVSFSRVPCDWSASGENVREQVAWACPPFVEMADATVEAALDAADVVIVAVHGGAEGELCPSSFMTELNQRWADLGVHAVVNGHPHVLQGVTILDGGNQPTLVAHSTGNFAFPPSRGITGNTAIIELVVSEPDADASPEVAMRIVPVRSDGGVLTVPSDAQRAAIIEQMNGVSSGAVVTDDGMVVADPNQAGRCS